MAAKVSLPSINEMFPEHMLGPWYGDRDRPTHDQTHEPQQALRTLEPPYAPQPPLSPQESSYDLNASRLPDPSPSRARPSFRVQIPPAAPYEPSQYTPSSSYAPSSATSVYPPSSVYTPSSSSSTLPSYAPSPATFRAAPLPPSPYMLQPPDAFPPQTQPYPAQAFANPLQQPYGATPYGLGAAPGPAASEEKKHSCPHCHKRFNRPSSLSIHVNTHTGAKPFRCPFPGCSRAFNVNSNMRRHWRNHVSAARRAGGPVPAAPAPAPEPAQGPSSRPAAPTALPPPVRPAEAYPQGRALEYAYAEYGAPRAPYAAPPPPPPQHQPPYADAPRYPRQDRPPTPPLSHSASSSPQSSSGHSLPPVAPPPLLPPPPVAHAAGKAYAPYAPYRARLAGPAHAPEEPFGREEEDELVSGEDEREGEGEGEGEGEDEDDEAYTPPPSPPPPVQHAPEGVYGRARSRSSPRLAPTRYTPYAAAAPPRREAWGARPEGRARSSTVAGAGAGVGGRWG